MTAPDPTTAEARAAEYVVVVRGSHGAVVHRATCSYIAQVKSPLHWTPVDEDPGDQPCSRCLPDGIFANEAKRLLEPWAEQLCQLNVDIERHVKGLPDDELALLGRAARWPDTGNSWWATYRVAQIVKDEVMVEQRRRMREAAEQSTSPGVSQ